MTLIPSFRDEYLKTLLTALKHPYVSTSSHDGIRTGNGYQSIDLNGLMAVGVRPHRDIFLRHLNLTGKSILDIGANLGEVSRMARKYGAALVDGYEYDTFFVETGRMINAINGVTRVSMFQGDATDPKMYADMKYDAVFAFSVFVYIRKVLPEIAKITDCMVFETHTLDHGLDFYLNRILPIFPSFRVIGFPDMANDIRKSRALVIFGKTPMAVDSILKLQAVQPKNYFNHSFFSTHGTAEGSLPAFLLALEGRLHGERDLQLSRFDQRYLEIFCLGYSEYLKSGRVDSSNVFALNFKAAIDAGRIDPALKSLSQEELISKISLRFQDFDNAAAGRWHLIPPVKIHTKHEGHLRFVGSEANEIRAENVDGHHRFFLHQLFRRPSVDAIIQEPAVQVETTRSAVYRLG